MNDQEASLTIQSWWRARIQARRYSSQKKLHHKRSAILSQLIEKESTYVNKLRLLVDSYYSPLKKAVSAGKCDVSVDELRTIFYGIDVLLGFSEVLLSKLSALRRNFVLSSRFGPVFEQFGGCLDLYAAYVKNFDESRESIRKALNSRNSDFKSFLRAVRNELRDGQESHEDVVDLSSLLILPIQHVPWYDVQIRGLITNTWKEHEDQADLSVSLRKVRVVVELINDKKRDAENMARVTEIISKLSGPTPLPHDASRRFLREGHLVELTNDGTVKKGRFCFVFSDMLIVTRFSKKTKTYELRARIPLLTAQLLSADSNTEIEDPHVVFVVATRSTSFMFQTKNRMEKAAWTSDIRWAIMKLQESFKKRESSNSSNVISLTRANTAKSIIESRYKSLKLGISPMDAPSSPPPTSPPPLASNPSNSRIPSPSHPPPARPPPSMSNKPPKPPPSISPPIAPMSRRPPASKRFYRPKTIYGMDVVEMSDLLEESKKRLVGLQNEERRRDDTAERKAEETKAKIVQQYLDIKESVGRRRSFRRAEVESQLPPSNETRRKTLEAQKSISEHYSKLASGTLEKRRTFRQPLPPPAADSSSNDNDNDSAGGNEEADDDLRTVIAGGDEEGDIESVSMVSDIASDVSSTSDVSSVCEPEFKKTSTNPLVLHTVGENDPIHPIEREDAPPGAALLSMTEALSATMRDLDEGDEQVLASKDLLQVPAKKKSYFSFRKGRKGKKKDSSSSVIVPTGSIGDSIDHREEEVEQVVEQEEEAPPSPSENQAELLDGDDEQDEPILNDEDDAMTESSTTVGDLVGEMDAFLDLDVFDELERMQEEFVPKAIDLYTDIEIQAIITIQSGWRMFVEKKKYQKRARVVKHRQMLVNEIVSSEEVYVKQLKIIIDLYSNPLSQAAKDPKKEILSADVVRRLFSGIVPIFKFNQIFLEKLKERVVVSDRFTKIGDIFLSMMQFFKVYIAYVKGFDDIDDLANECLKDKEFAKFVQEVRNNPVSGRLDLHSFLILPVQRIPRYNLLLRDLIKKTDEEHPDYQDLQSAFNEMSAITSMVNERKKEEDSIRRVRTLQDCFVGLDLDETLAQPYRRFLLESFASVRMESEGVATIKRRMVFLFNDMLVITKHTHKSKKIEENRYHVLRVIRIETLQGIVGGLVEGETALVELVSTDVIVSLLPSSHPYTLSIALVLPTTQIRDEWKIKLDESFTSAQEGLKTRDEARLRSSASKANVFKKLMEQQYKTAGLSARERLMQRKTIKAQQLADLAASAENADSQPSEASSSTSTSTNSSDDGGDLPSNTASSIESVSGTAGSAGSESSDTRRSFAKLKGEIPRYGSRARPLTINAMAGKALREQMLQITEERERKLPQRTGSRGLPPPSPSCVFEVPNIDFKNDAPIDDDEDSSDPSVSVAPVVGMKRSPSDPNSIASQNSQPLPPRPPPVSSLRAVGRGKKAIAPPHPPPPPTGARAGAGRSGIIPPLTLSTPGGPKPAPKPAPKPRPPPPPASFYNTSNNRTIAAQQRRPRARSVGEKDDNDDETSSQSHPATTNNAPQRTASVAQFRVPSVRGRAPPPPPLGAAPRRSNNPHARQKRATIALSALQKDALSLALARGTPPPEK